MKKSIKVISFMLTLALILSTFAGICSFSVSANAITQKGDVNYDETVNGKDAFLLRKYIAGWDVSVSTITADVNADDKIDSKDSLLMRQFVAGYNVNFVKNSVLNFSESSPIDNGSSYIVSVVSENGKYLPCESFLYGHYYINGSIMYADGPAAFGYTIKNYLDIMPTIKATNNMYIDVAKENYTLSYVNLFDAKLSALNGVTLNDVMSLDSGVYYVKFELDWHGNSDEESVSYYYFRILVY